MVSQNNNSDFIPLGSRPIDRAGHHRSDPAWLDTAFARDDVLVLLVHKGLPLLAPDGGLVWLGPEAAKVAPDARRLFLGLDKQGTPVFALGLPDGFELESSLIAGTGEFTDFRMAVTRLAELEANLASTARSIFEWHVSHRFCARCGAESEVTEAGWKRICPECRAEHFPRTDPVAIMLATRGDKCLLGRQKAWPAGMWSCLAGFIEPGETLEQGAARELHEEAGLICHPANAEYLFCQPWPFPSSLMIGMLLPAENEDITVDPHELEAAQWVSRTEAREILAGEHAEIFAPPPFAVAHHILKEWAERED
ncbi:NAD(+) diphosphatase [Henriciella aquimarina]|uniref:NAD(+) diphosphatase n=1 Tax=Henriciella aquimarina TaxID=545261 RepID=UPI000A065D38|nr:NAD(+) diphosphatase [Henriciella aquimarina]